MIVRYKNWEFYWQLSKNALDSKEVLINCLARILWEKFDNFQTAFLVSLVGAHKEFLILEFQNWLHHE